MELRQRKQINNALPKFNWGQNGNILNNYSLNSNIGNNYMSSMNLSYQPAS